MEPRIVAIVGDDSEAIRAASRLRGLDSNNIVVIGGGMGHRSYAKRLLLAEHNLPPINLPMETYPLLQYTEPDELGVSPKMMALLKRGGVPFKKRNLTEDQRG